MNRKEEYIKTLPDVLPKEDISKIEPFFMNDLSAGAKSKPSGNINNYVYFHESLKWGILRKEGKYGLENTESYELVKLSWSPRFLGMKMGIATAWTMAKILNTDEIEKASLSGLTLFMSDSEKKLISALQNFK